MQKRNRTHSPFYPFLILLAISFIVSSCRTTRELAVIEIKPMTALKVMRKVERETPVYNNYEAKKVSIEFNFNGNKNSVSGQFKVKRNKCIILSARKLSLPLGRGMVSPDSIVFVNFFDKSYMSGNFEDIKNLLGADIDYNLIQALLTADVSRLIQNEDYDKTRATVIDSQMYRIDCRMDPRIERLLSSGNEKRINRYLKKMDGIDDNDLSFWVDPKDFVIRKISMKDDKNKENITIRYNHYEQIGRNLFPQEASFSYTSPDQKVSFLVKISKSAVNSDNDFNFSIPEKFEKVNFSGSK